MFFAEGYYGYDDALYGAARLLRIVADSGRTVQELLEALELGSLCAHGGGMPAPIRSLLEHFPEELGLA